MTATAAPESTTASAIGVAVAIVVGFTLASPGAHARDGTPLPPWYQGVAAADRQAAESLFEEGLSLHRQLLRDRAAGKYEQALERWEHPHMRFNLARLWTDMGQYLRAYDNLERVLAWGLPAFDEGFREDIRTLERTLLEQHLARVHIQCDEPGAEVALDGKPRFVAPGSADVVVRPGEHVVTARKTGFFPVVQAVTVTAGNRGRVTLQMSVDGLVHTRRWQPWKPWMVLGAGLASSLIGAGLEWQAARDFDRAAEVFDQEQCAGRPCLPQPPGLYRRAVWEERVAVVSMIAGGLAMATGLTLVILNRSRASRTRDRQGTRLHIEPIFTREGAGLSTRFRF